MTASEILQLATTVATVQILCDLVFNWRAYSQEPYQRALSALSRSKLKYEQETIAIAKEKDKAKSSAPTSKKSKADRLFKRLQRAKDDHAEARGVVARKHIPPGFFTLIIFVILLRILGTEHKGKIIGVLPFVPYSFTDQTATQPSPAQPSHPSPAQPAQLSPAPTRSRGGGSVGADFYACVCLSVCVSVYL
jgi:hypothetical protein